jgi:hypothetical protein
MAIQLLTNGGALVEGGEAARIAPVHVQNMPLRGNYYRYSGFTGTIGAALAANSELFQFRWLSSTKTYALIHSVKLDGAGIVAVATAAGPIGWCVMPARSWTVAGSGGTRIATSGDNLQTETALPAPQVSDIGIATTGALTVGTKTLDANCAGQYITGVLTGAATVAQVSPLADAEYLFNASAEGYMPLVLGNQEGFVIRTTHAGPAALTYTIGFTVVWSEVTAF